MEVLPKCTINNMIQFVPRNNEEELLYNSINKNVLYEYLNDTQHKYNSGYFYLGGQIKMTPDDEITAEKINEVREITRLRTIEYGGPCNSLECYSISKNEKSLYDIQKIVEFYLKIKDMRTK